MKNLSFLILIFFSTVVNAECRKEYARSDYKHWLSTPESKKAGLKNVRELAIKNATVHGLFISKGRVIAGHWHDLYTGQVYDINKVKPDGEHLISMSWASDRGGLCATQKQRTDLANDIDNIWIVHPSANRKKGKRVSDFLPPNLAICTRYLNQIAKVLERHKWITPTKEDRRKFVATYKKCDEVRNGILIQKQKNWFMRFFNG